MLIISYDFADNKVRAKFAKFIKQYGEKIQYSVYQIKNSQRILKNILAEIEHKYKKNFKNTDSILIFSICNGCKSKIIRYGSAKHEESEVVFLS
jgi:CRISPR-associated endonuclease Cas2